MRPKAGDEPPRSWQAAGPRARGSSGTDEPGDLDDAGVGDVPATEREDRAPAEAPDAPGSDYKDRWLRAEAELQNSRRRGQRDRDEAVRFAEERILLDVVSFIDDLERALEAAQQADAPESWTQGVRLVLNRMTESLARHGVTAVEPIGQPFDPRVHEALLEVEAAPGTAPGAVAQVLRKGYRRDDRVLRPARVAVARHPAPEGS